jgi:hypothetical protein
LSRNNVAFKQTAHHSFLQVIFRGTYWIKHWAQLFKKEEGDALKKRSRLLEISVLELFSKFVWRHRLRIEA